MKNGFNDLTGLCFGRLTVIKLDHKENKNGVYWLCKCDCGNEKVVNTSNLKFGNTKSCGCYRIETVRKNRKNNTYVIEDDYVIGYDVRYNEPFYIDLDDYDKIKDIVWTKKDGYIISTRKYGSIFLARFIMGCQKGDGIIVDHFNGDTVDNRKYNLRKTDRCVNSLNRDDTGNGSLKVLGVRKKNNRYEARITIHGHSKFIGSYKTLEEAHQARINAEKEYAKECGVQIINGRRQ